MNPVEMIGLLGDLERDFPVNDWRVGDVQVWPLIRTLLGYRGTLPSLESGAGPSRGSRLRKHLDRAAIVCDAFMAPFRDRTANAPRIAPADLFFLSYSGARQARLRGGWTDLFAAPLLDALARAGGRGLVWEFSLAERYRRPRGGPSYLAQRELFLASLKSFLDGGAPAAAALPGYAEACLRLQERGVFSGSLEPNRLAARARSLLALAERFGKALDAIRPRAVFTSNYSPYEAALCLAARRRGIRSVEIQHGLQGAAHPQYASWSRAPRDGYALLPSVYWCWDDASAATINAWSTACAPQHRAVVGGNPWLEYCAQLPPDAFDPRFAGFPPDACGRRRVLLTLQDPGVIYPDGRLLPRFVVDGILALGDRFEWWIRFHPLMKRDDQGLRALFGNAAPLLETDAANALPLALLLRRADLHATHSSSSVIDAERFGIRSVLWSDYGASLMAAQIGAGTASRAITAAEFAAAVEAQLARGPIPVPAPQVRTPDLLSELLAAGG